jgi:hypothetical protein
VSSGGGGVAPVLLDPVNRAISISLKIPSSIFTWFINIFKIVLVALLIEVGKLIHSPTWWTYLLLLLVLEHYSPLWTLASNTIFLHSWRSHPSGWNFNCIVFATNLFLRDWDVNPVPNPQPGGPFVAPIPGYHCFDELFRGEVQGISRFSQGEGISQSPIRRIQPTVVQELNFSSAVISFKHLIRTAEKITKWSNSHYQYGMQAYSRRCNCLRMQRYSSTIILQSALLIISCNRPTSYEFFSLEIIFNGLRFC